MAAILIFIALGMIHFAPKIAKLGELGNDDGLSAAKFLFAVVIIITVGSFGGWVAGQVGQPRVVGEMTAGIALGPSLLGQFLPESQHWLFPPQVVPQLSLMSQLIITVFVFLVGVNVPLKLLRRSGGVVTVLGIGLVVVPLTCGILLAMGPFGIYRPPSVTLPAFLIFIGVAMGVTAFPVLVRILKEHGLIGSRIGTVGLAAASLGDAIAWCLLVIAVSAIHNNLAAAAIRIVTLLIMFTSIVWIVIRPALRRFLALTPHNSTARAVSLLVILFGAASGASITEWIGVNGIFGAFLMGAAMPRENFLIPNLASAIDRCVNAALPLFFAMIGLDVEIGILRTSTDFLSCGLLLLVAIGSKMVVTVVIARLGKLTWRDSLGLGVMMNCRGLTELVILAVGLSLGIIAQNLYVMFVVMTLVTTMMTGPLLGRLRLGMAMSSRND